MKKSKHYLKRFLILGLCLLFPTIFWCQIRISESIQPSKIVNQDKNALYFIDFWATWCAPCISASKYLEVLQKQNFDNFYIISLTKENPEVVDRFFTKHKTDLAVALDFEGETFKKYNVQSLPYGVLLNVKGEKLWEGHPADFKNHHIRKYLSRNTSRVPIDAFIELKAYEKSEIVNVVLEPEEDFELLASNSTSDFLQIKKLENYTSYVGNLKSILAYLFKVYDEQIQISSSIENKYYTLNIKHSSRKHKNLVKHILKRLKLKISNITNKGEVLVLQINTPKFWDTKQIDWGNDTPKYLIGDNQIEADNVTFEDVSYRLSNLLEMPIVVNSFDDTLLHDWQIHYKYFELMQTDLLENFGIQAKKESMEYPVYLIQKKTP